MFSRGLNQMIGLVIGVILARLLSPEEFGVLGMVTVLTGFAHVFVDFGFTSAIIQNKMTDTNHWSSVFWLNILFSLAIVILLTFLAPFVASFYDRPVLKTITIAIAWTFFFQSLSLVQQALMKKELRFKTIAIVAIISQTIAGVIAIIAAIKGMSYWSLVIKLYVSIFITNIGFWWVTSWYPKFLLKNSALKDLLNFSLPLFGTQSLNYWTRNIDYLMIGKVLGDGALGIYSRAYSLMLSPLQNISRVVSSVMFPAYSIIQDDKKRIRQIYLKISRIIAFITFPTMFGLCVVSEPFILLLLGEKWEAVIPLVQILAPLGALQSIGTLNGNIFLSQGATKLQLKVGGLGKLVIICSLISGLLLYGLNGIASFYVISSILVGLVMFYYMGKLINLSVKEILNNLSSIFYAAIIMAIALLVFDAYVSFDWKCFSRLLVLITIGIGVYGSCVYLFKIKELQVISQYFQTQNSAS